MKLCHYSEAPLVFDSTRTYRVSEPSSKPIGFWLSVGDDWKQWCDGNEFRPESLTHRTDFMLTPEANVLQLTTSKDLRLFTQAFKWTSRWERCAIDWPRVIARYDGIIIAPYQWDCRLDDNTFWYYPWDCASGCFWNLKAVTVVNQR